MPRPMPSDPLSRLLVGVDFSAGSRAALSRVPGLPLASDAEITLLHVGPVRPDSGQPIRAPAGVGRRLQGEASDLVRHLRAAGLPRIRVRTRLAHGRVHEQILRHAEATELVLLGRHGQRSFRDLLVGSTAERVLLGAVAPVLLTTGARRAPYRRLMVAVDLSPASLPALHLAARVAAGRARVLDVVHAYETANAQLLYRSGSRAARSRYARECRTQARHAVQRLLQETGTAPLVRHLILRGADPRKAILDAAEARQADLLVLGTHGRSGLTRWLLGSVAAGVMRHAGCDVLVVPSRRSAKRQARSAA